ncbi:MAG: HpcH/HpaI aldolase/citrate lyase family protein [Pseudomonadota bacterium]
MTHRSFLFTPANHPRRVAKALASAADAAILDLEDAVAETEKAAARASLRASLQEPRRTRAFVRINARDTVHGLEDLEAAIGPELDGIVLPKAEGAADVQTIDWVMGQLERRHGLAPGSIELMPIIESAAGLVAAEAIARAAGGRVRRLCFGAADFTFDLDMTWSRDETELTPARAHLVAVSRAAGLEPPVDTVWVDLQDTNGLEASVRRAAALGFRGKLCIHPDQLEPVHRVFTPSEEEIAYATKVVAAFEAAEAEGSAAIRVDGRFVDYPIVYRAQRTLARARRDD